MAIKQIVPIFITLQGDGTATTFVFPVQNLYQLATNGSVPFGITGSIPSSVVVNNTPYAVTSATVDVNGNVTITFTAAPPASTSFNIELDVIFNSGSATSSSPVVSQNVTLTGTSSVTVSGTVSENLIQLNSVALGSPSAYGTSPGAVNVPGVNAFVTNTVAVTLASTTITGTVAVTQSTSPWVVSNGGTFAVQAAQSGTWNIGTVTAVTAITNALPAGSNTIGAVTQASGPWTINETQLAGTALGAPSNYGTSPGAVSVQGVNAFITNTPAVTVSGTVGVTQSTSPWVVSLTSTTITGTVAVTQSTSPWVTSGNLTHNNAAPAANNIGVLPAVASTAAPTYTTGDQVLLSTDLSGNLRVTFAAAGEQNVNVNQWAGTTLGAPSNYGTSPGAVEVPGVNAFVTNTVPVTLTSTTITGTVAVTQSTSPWVVSNGGTFAVQAAQSGTWSVEISGHAGATLDASVTANTAPTNGIAVLGVSPSVTPTLTGGQSAALQLDVSGRLNTDTQALAGTQLGAPSNYGTSPGAVAVAGVNAFVTNTVAVTLTSTTITGTVAVTQSTSPWVSNVTQWASTALGTPQTFGTAPTGVVIGTSSDIYIAGTRARSNQTTTAAGVMDVNIVGSLGATNSVTNGTFIAITDNTTKAGVIAGTTALKTDWSSEAGTAITTVPVAFGTGTPSGNAPGVNAALFVGTTPVRSNQATTATGAVDNNLVGIKGTTVVTVAAGVQEVGIVGSTGATLDAAIGPATAPTNALAISGQYNVTQPSPTNSQVTALQQDESSNLLVYPGLTANTGAAWTSATTVNTLQYTTGTTTQGQPLGGQSILVQLDMTTTLTAGAVTFQGTYDNVNWVTIPVAQVLNPQTYQPLTNPYSFVASTNTPFLILLQGFIGVRANLTTVITGTGSVTPHWNVLQSSPVQVITSVVTAAGGTNVATGSIGATKTAIKTTGGNLFGWYIYNSNSSVAYVQIFNLASASVTLGTTAPTMSIGIPPGSAANMAFDVGISYGTAITIAITTTRAGATGPTNTVDYNIFYV